jgi:hypothetical protein
VLKCYVVPTEPDVSEISFPPASAGFLFGSLLDHEDGGDVPSKRQILPKIYGVTAQKIVLFKVTSNPSRFARVQCAGAYIRGLFLVLSTLQPVARWRPSSINGNNKPDPHADTLQACVSLSTRVPNATRWLLEQSRTCQ